MVYLQRVEVRETHGWLLQGGGGIARTDPRPPGGTHAVMGGAEVAGILPGDIRLILANHGHADHDAGVV